MILRVMTDLGLMFPSPAVTKTDRLSPRVSESSDASTIDSSHSSFPVCQLIYYFFLLPPQLLNFICIHAGF